MLFLRVLTNARLIPVGRPARARLLRPAWYTVLHFGTKAANELPRCSRDLPLLSFGVPTGRIRGDRVRCMRERRNPGGMSVGAAAVWLFCGTNLQLAA